MSRCSIILSLFILLMSACSRKQKDSILKDEDKILGVWVITPLGPISRPADTLYFTKKDDAYKLSFECYGAPAINWPSHAEIPYRFENGKLSYQNYYDSASGFIVASSFKWIIPGKEFQIFRRHLLLYMSAEYTVTYTKIR